MPFIMSQLIEALRWMGAIAVLAVHTNNMFINRADIMSAPHAPPVYAWWFFSAFELGHQAVLAFFVMSGYLVGGAVLAHMQKKQEFLREYFIHRVVRIYLVIGPALVLTFVFDSVGRALFSDSGVYDWQVFRGHFTPTLFFTSLANLQGIAFEYFGTNGPLWSLACEFWYYVTFPLLLLPFARSYSPAFRLGGFALGVALTAALATPPSWFRFGYILWAMGAFATLAPRAIVSSRWLALSFYAATVIVIRLAVRGPILLEYPWLMDAADLFASALFVMVLLSFRYGPHEGFALLRPKIHKTFADFSFSLYSVHMPILIIARAATGHLMGRDWPTELATSRHYAIALAAMCIAVVCAYFFSRITEAKTGAARRALRSAVERISPTNTEPSRASKGT